VAETNREFDALVRANTALYRALLAIGEAIAGAAGQSNARSQCLQQIIEESRTVAAIAVRQGTTRQSVQRVADLLVADGLAVYTDNPHDRRAQLLTLTDRGREALRLMHRKHQDWVRRAGAHLSGTDLPELTRQLTVLKAAIQEVDV
jgi:DNA-binding MarR family transcriptional regulator